MTKYEKLCITCHLSRCDGPNAKRCPQQKLKKAETIARRAYHRQRYQEKAGDRRILAGNSRGVGCEMNYDEECRALLAQLQAVFNERDGSGCASGCGMAQEIALQNSSRVVSLTCRPLQLGPSVCSG